MKKTLLFLLLLIGLLGLLFIVSCAPSGLKPEEREFFGDESAMAGQAVALGCTNVPVTSCTTDALGSVTAARIGRTGLRTASFPDRCDRSTAFDYSCISTPTAKDPNAKSLRLCRNRCVSGEECQAGQCVPLPASVVTPTVLVQAQASPRVEVISSGTFVLVEANDVLILEAPATADLGSVAITTGVTTNGGAAVVVVGLEGVEHHVYIPNTRNGGVFSCPSGRTIAETIPICSSVITHSYADCVAGIGGCSIVGSQYRVLSSGSSHGERSVEICGDYIDHNANSEIDEGCSPYNCVDSDPENDPAVGGVITITAANGQVMTSSVSQSWYLPADKCA